MSIKPRGVDITKNYVISGVKVIGAYTYVLLIDITGQTLIKRIKSDDSEIKYHCKEESETIDEMWADPESHASHGDGYIWIHAC